MVSIICIKLVRLGLNWEAGHNYIYIMTGTNQLFNVSGALLEPGATGSHALQIVMLCGVANGSVVVPVAVSGNGVLLS